MTASPEAAGTVGGSVGPVAVLAIPLAEDMEAEGWVAGCAAGTYDGTALALGHGLLEWHFHRPACWRALLAAADAPRCEDIEERLRWIAEAAGVEVYELRRWWHTRPVFRDTAGHLARRVIAAAEVRDRRCRGIEQLLAEGAELVAA